ncbi:unnamed protein product [Adineta steineri]|uniref:Uncharacterized protein n=1 Tax=Adineta steineri TaxID=433720 RepID=A0A818QCM5_9BILA|nr:unnamed protein product [Adineta steineri]CAF0865641.1 unnamed protein product [Adineta steineri]CAF0931390.1 unnamed protein product [Adineta steineri]CAF3639075.1 unnamed protein product [Adineta steineri]
MAPPKSSFQITAQAETLLIYGIFLFLTGLVQIAVTIGHRYIIEKSNHNFDDIKFINLLPISFTMNDIHLWYIYPSAILAILICMSSLMSFISSSVYIGLLIIHTLEYWQTISSPRFKSFLSTTTTTTRLLVPFDEPATFVNLALLITFTLALVQALLSLIGAVISCLWSPCCISSVPSYKSMATNTHYAQTTPHRFENTQSSTIRSVKRQQYPEAHRFITTNESSDSVINGFLHKSPLIRSNYDDV